MTLGGRPQSDSEVTTMGIAVTSKALWGRPPRVIFDPFYCHFNYFGVLGLLDGHSLQKVRFETPSSVSFFALAEFRGESSVRSSRPLICCVPKRTHRVFRRTHRVCRRTQWGSVSSLLRNSTFETVFRPFPRGGCAINPNHCSRIS